MRSKKTASLVGIVIPCFNQGIYVNECVDSLHQQTYQYWKAVVLDDASTDNVSYKLCQDVQSDKVSFVGLSHNQGRALIRNEGVRQLGAVDYVLMIDCDDYLSSDYIQRLVKALEENPAAGLAYGLLHWVGDCQRGDEDRIWPNQPWSVSTMYTNNVIPGPGVLFRKSALDQTDGWRADFTFCSGEDYDIWLQVVEAGWDAIWLREARYNYRQHSSSFLATANRTRGLEVQVNILKHHYAHIVRTIGVSRYIENQLLPHLLTAIRRMDHKFLSDILYPLFIITKGAVLLPLFKYYARRLFSLNTR